VGSRTPRTSPRKAWLHLATSSVSSAGLLSPTPSSFVKPHLAQQGRKRPQPLTTFALGLESREETGPTPTTADAGAAGANGCDTTTGGSARSAASDATADTRFPFISPVEPVLTLARFHRSLNKVYIPLDDEEELEVVRTCTVWCVPAGSFLPLPFYPPPSLNNYKNTHIG
jgi:hypothetical protein